MRPVAAPGGFSLLELMVVLVLVAILLAVAATRFTEWRDRSSARRAAQVFARDLTVARSSAAREQDAVVVRFYESGRWYTVTTGSGREMARRRFGPDGDVYLSAIDLQTPGDSLVFDARGVADLSGIVGSLGEALFTAGDVTYEVDFNSLGSSRVNEH